MVETINRFIRTSRKLMQELGREPTPEEIAKEMGIEADKVREIIKVSQEPTSLEAPVGEEKTLLLEILFQMMKFVLRIRLARSF